MVLPSLLQGGVTALAWSAHGYQLLVAEQGQAGRLHQLEFARQVHGAHRVVQPWAEAGGGSSGAGPGPGPEELQVLQVRAACACTFCMRYTRVPVCMHGLCACFLLCATSGGGFEGQAKLHCALLVPVCCASFFPERATACPACLQVSSLCQLILNRSDSTRVGSRA